MSTYSTLHGTITLDRAAAMAFAATPSWQWVAADPNLGDGKIAATDRGDTLELDFGYGLYRNLGRYIQVDLSRAQAAGAVTGTLTDDCVDGVCIRTVTRFDGRTAICGTGDCLNQPVQAGPARVLEVTDPHTGELVISFLTGEPDSDQTGDIELVELAGAETLEACCCGGFDDDGEPICATRTAKA